MPDQILKTTKVIFIAQTIVGVVFGLTFLLFGEAFLILEVGLILIPYL
ncbi:MAG: hypothetical protein KGD74_08285 [Candidatus Lokiarchaeota archaeon]|nr:hypothetical protein [Candidatus Lokiarchaeota archaeon]